MYQSPPGGVRPPTTKSERLPLRHVQSGLARTTVAVSLQVDETLVDRSAGLQNVDVGLGEGAGAAEFRGHGVLALGGRGPAGDRILAA